MATLAALPATEGRVADLRGRRDDLAAELADAELALLELLGRVQDVADHVPLVLAAWSWVWFTLIFARVMFPWLRL